MSQPSDKETSSTDMRFEAPVAHVTNHHEGDVKNYQHNLVTQTFQMGAEKITEFFAVVWRQIAQQIIPEKSNTDIQLIEVRERILTAEIIREKLRNNENLDELTSYLQLQQNEKFQEINKQLKIQELQQQERIYQERHELIREGHEIERERLRIEKESLIQQFIIEAKKAEREEEIISLQKEAIKWKKQYSDKYIDYLNQWRTEQIQHQREQNQVNWDIQNWQSILSPEETKQFFKELQNKNEVSVLWSPPKISSNSPFNLDDVKPEIDYQLQDFLQRNYNNNCTASCHCVFRSPLEDMEARKLAKDLQPHCAILIHSSITDKDFYLKITFAGEQCPIPPWHWEQFKEKLEREGKSSKEAVYIIRKLIVLIYKIVSGFFVDLYYLNVNEFHEPRLSAVKSEIDHGFSEQWIEFYLTLLTKIQNKISANKFNEFGEKLFLNTEYVTALLAFEKAISLQPDFFEAWNNKGKTQCQLRMYEEAIQSFVKATELKSDFLDAWQNKGFAESKLMRYDHAIQSYTKAIELYPDFPEALYQYANTLLKLTLNDFSISSCNDIARVDEAIASHQKAFQIKPELSKYVKQEFLEDLYKISCLLYQRKNYSDALKIYNELAINEADLPALLSQQTLVNYWRKRGYILLENKEYQLSVNSYIRAIQLQPKNHKLWLLKGVAHFQNGDVIESLSSLIKALMLKPSFYKKRAEKIIILSSKPITNIMYQVIANFKELISLLKEL